MRACVENNPTFCLFWRILLFKFLQVWKLLWKIDHQIIKDIITLIFCKIKNKRKEKTKHQKTYIGDIFVWKKFSFFIFIFYFALLLIVTIILPNPFYIDVLSELFDNIWIPLLSRNTTLWRLIGYKLKNFIMIKHCLPNCKWNHNHWLMYASDVRRPLIG